ncbi:MAG: hypothetical protein M1818_001097 [Claussenomyces sp. TS43310]|nr:MAG: hypothetical protein M1818_001097 [Claussenomyces sp. TS43310]
MVFSKLFRVTDVQSPLLRTLLPSVCAAFALQTAVAIPSIVSQSDRFYDLSGSITYVSVTALSLYLPALRARLAATAVGSAKAPIQSVLATLTGASSTDGFNWRQIMLSTAVTLWATRLGTHLFQRIMADGHDSRFNEIRKSPSKFLGAFMAQATWVSLCLMPVLAINSIPNKLLSTLPKFKISDAVGIFLFIGGLGFEIVADRQKSKWVKEKKEKKHDEDFLSRGLWSKSRHPNYFGESMLWTGIATVSTGVLVSRVGQLGMGLAGIRYGKILAIGMASVSPAFVTFLLLKVSGVPLSESKYDHKYGHRKDYQEWKRNTPMFIPKL